MKLVTTAGDVQAPGCVIAGEVLDFGRAAGLIPEAAALPNSIRLLLDETTGFLDTARFVERTVADGAESLRVALRKAGALNPIADVKFAAPIPDPKTILSHGKAYHSHIQDWEPDAQPELPSHPPSGFLKSPTSAIGHGDAIILPPAAPDRVDYEGEFCVVFGRECYNVSRDEAMDYVVGYTIINDVSARNWVPKQRAAEGMEASSFGALNILYKSFPTFCPMGMNVTTKDEIADYRDLVLETHINGELMQRAGLKELIWDIPQLIEAYSKVLRFQPGDIMSTGTPGGVGAGRTPPRFLQPGDEVTVSVTGVGQLTNPVRAA